MWISSLEISEIIEIEQYELPVAAGSGVDLDEYADKFPVKVIKNHKTQHADFLRITGNSMEPMYCGGDRILVKKQENLDLGEIGIWLIDGKGYVKKKGADRLISLNPRVPDVYVAEYKECRTVGRVLGVLDPDWIVEE